MILGAIWICLLLMLATFIYQRIYSEKNDSVLTQTYEEIISNKNPIIDCEVQEFPYNGKNDWHLNTKRCYWVRYSTILLLRSTSTAGMLQANRGCTPFPFLSKYDSINCPSKEKLLFRGTLDKRAKDTLFNLPFIQINKQVIVNMNYVVGCPTRYRGKDYGFIRLKDDTEVRVSGPKFRYVEAFCDSIRYRNVTRPDSIPYGAIKTRIKARLGMTSFSNE